MPRALSLADFLGSLVTCAVGSPRGDRRTVRFGSEGGFACPPHNLRPSTCNSVCRRHFHCSVSTIAARASDGILTVSSIGLGFRLILRSRLTLNRLALFRKPWSYGEGVSRPLCRYLCLHLLFRALQRSLEGRLQRRAECSPTDDALRAIPRLRHRTSCPIIIHARPLDR